MTHVLIRLTDRLELTVELGGDMDADAEALRLAYRTVGHWLQQDDRARERLGAPLRPAAPDPAPTPAPPQETRSAGAPRGVVAFCAEHGMAPCRLSAARFNKDGDRLFHALDEADWHEDERGAVVKNHSLWWRETVDRDGKSNEGRPVPGGA